MRHNINMSSTILAGGMYWRGTGVCHEVASS